MFRSETYETSAKLRIVRTCEPIDDVPKQLRKLEGDLDTRRGVLLTSRYEYPGRYTRWDIGFVDPPIAITAIGRELRVEALNARGELLLPVLERALALCPACATLRREGSIVRARSAEATASFAEEERTRIPSVFSLLRALIALFHDRSEPYLGLYGAFGYDLGFQLDPVTLRLPRPSDHRDLVLYVPDELIVVDRQREEGLLVRYDFELDGRSTQGLPRTSPRAPFDAAREPAQAADHAPGEYEALVEHAKGAFERGDLFEVVPGQTFFRRCEEPPSALFARLSTLNPAPYGFLMNLGESEHLVGASPEMFVRVQGERVETCPISGTIARGVDAIGDARQILALLSSPKEASELTMCTDVDRNDKSRVCRPESVRVIGRRQIELYARLIHTVDHVEGMLREGCDALDAFITHAWAVTVTGAPKLWAMQFIEDHEKSPRAWYGGAVGKVGFDGSLNTGLTLRTIRIKRGVAEVRAGATLLYDSVPADEERETRLKASSLLEVLAPRRAPATESARPTSVGAGKRILLVDYQDSFVHTLAGYFRRTGATVTTLRAGFDLALLERMAPDLLVLSPGPGTPSFFATERVIAAACERALPVFGVCLGLQALVEYFGGELGVLPQPVHGKPSTITVTGGRLFEGLPRSFVAGRYHSLHALRVPELLEVTAVAAPPALEAGKDVVMAVEHRSLPIAGVQFHPESILTAEGELGLTLVRNAVARLAR